jgi:hypothetical protein
MNSGEAAYGSIATVVIICTVVILMSFAASTEQNRCLKDCDAYGKTTLNDVVIECHRVEKQP